MLNIKITTIEELQNMHWAKFETFCAELMTEAGYKNARTSSKGVKGGDDGFFNSARNRCECIRGALNKNSCEQIITIDWLKERRSKGISDELILKEIIRTNPQLYDNLNYPPWFDLMKKDDYTKKLDFWTETPAPNNLP